MKVELITNINVSVVKANYLRIKRVNTQIMRCGHCGGKLKLVKVFEK